MSDKTQTPNSTEALAKGETFALPGEVMIIPKLEEREQVDSSGFEILEISDSGEQKDVNWVPSPKTDTRVYIGKDLFCNATHQQSTDPFVFLKLSEQKRQLSLKELHEPTFYSRKPVEDVIRELGADMKFGLNTMEVEKRKGTFGSNELEKPSRVAFWKIFLDQFKDILVILLIIAAVVAFGIAVGTNAEWKEYIAPIFIVAIVLLIAILGAVQEGKAEDAIAALDMAKEAKALVIRRGERTKISVSEIVPGDILYLGSGAIVPADARIVKANILHLDEKMLTGESLPINKAPDLSEVKDRSREDIWEETVMVYRGCQVTHGDGLAVVTAIGMETKMGKISGLLNEVELGYSPLQIRLTNLGKKLGYASIAVSFLVFIIGVATKRGVDPTNNQPAWLQMLLIAVSLTVAAVPEGLPVCVTIALALGMRQMAKNKALIKKLKSVETLGCASVICSDKTGTLTSGAMTVVKFRTISDNYEVSGQGYSPEGKINKDLNRAGRQVLHIARMCNGASLKKDDITGKWIGTGNLTDQAMLAFSYKTDMKIECDKTHENPFDSTRKIMSTAFEFENTQNCFGQQRIIGVKGAPQYILEKCASCDVGNSKIGKMTPELLKEINNQVDAYCDQAYRVIALGYSVHGYATDPNEVEKDLVFVGIVAIFDPPREEVPEAIKEARYAGVQTRMITGDYAKTAKAVAKQIGLLQDCDDFKVLDCSELRRLTYEKKIRQRDGLITDTFVFARATPEDKIIIVGVLQARGFIVAMTGDGVNDSPALKKADIGIAMGITGTDAAKAAAPMILMDDSFASIVLAIKEGRRIYANISKFVYFLLSTNIAEVFLILGASFIGVPSPLVPVQILLLNLLTDSLPALALTNEVIEPNVMTMPPRPKNKSIIDKLMTVSVSIHTVILTWLTIMTYLVGLDWHVSDPDSDLALGIRSAQTMTMYVIVFAELLRGYTSRSLTESVFTQGLFTNKSMQYSVLGAITIMILIGNIPGVMDVFGMEYLDGKSWGWVIGVSFIAPVVDELTKYVYRRINFIG